MTAIAETFTLNPSFTWTSAIHFDELDPYGMLHNSRYATHVERATGAFFASHGYVWDQAGTNPDQYHVVRDLHVEFLRPFQGPGSMRIDLWVERLGETGCTYGFTCSSDDGKRLHARGRRTVVRVDPVAMRPVPWSDRFRAIHRELQHDLPGMP